MFPETPPESGGEQRRNIRQVKGREIVTDMDGFLQNPSMWSEEVAVVLAREVGIECLSEEQWRVLRFIRTYYLEQGKAPLNHKIKQGTGLSLKEIESLFPGGFTKGARRLAGLPKAKGCAAGH
ncbi:MAG: TusE/DsrC/DsvC family sulfur relay protein [Desulfohalobiaceae bacterium]|nr:TusE/DsrC/DsvC family sulfur relay protein [Desulfohalobiaceae bacterium]